MYTDRMIKCTFVSWLHVALAIVAIFAFVLFVVEEPYNRCEMTYMYQIPEFISVPLKRDVAQKFPRYNVYAYGEGIHSNLLSNGVYQGIPVIFVPGNGGSYRQVRSLGSVALRMFYESSYQQNFDVFTIDYDEELSGVYGEVLQWQTEFLFQAVHAIRNLYKKKNSPRVKPFQIVLVAHSVGGIICKGLLTMPEFDVSQVQILITLSSPHVRPVLPMDSYIFSYYKTVNLWWNANRNHGNLSHLSMISIHGGLMDKLVNADLSKLSYDTHINDIQLLTTHIPDVWVGSDHVCIVWCRQLIKKIVRMLFDLLDQEEKRLIVNLNKRRKVIAYHLLERNREKSYPQYAAPKQLQVKTNIKAGQILIVKDRFFLIKRNKLIDSLFISFILKANTTVVLLASGLEKQDWLFGCQSMLKKSEICRQGINLSFHAKVIPNLLEEDRKLFIFSADQLIQDQIDHLVIMLNSHAKPFHILSERYTINRESELRLPSILTSVITFFTYRTIVTIPVSQESIHYKLSLNEYTKVWHTYDFQLEVTSCYEDASQATWIHAYIPWYAQDDHFLVKSAKGEQLQFSLRLNVPRPSESNASAQLEMLLEPYCGYNLKVSYSIWSMLIQIIRYQSHLFLPFMCAILLSTFSLQVQSRNWSKITSFPESKITLGCLEKFVSLNDLLNFYFIRISLYGLLPLLNVLAFYFFKMFNFFFTVPQLRYLENNLNLDHMKLSEAILMHLFVYTVSYSTIFLISTLFHAFVLIFATLLNKFFYSIKLSFFESPLVNWSIPSAIVSSLLAAFTVFSCSSAGLLMLTTVHVLRSILFASGGLCLMQKHGLTRDSSFWHLHLTLFWLLCAAFAPLIPVGLVWMAGRSVSTYVHWFIDHQLILCFALVLSFGIFWQTGAKSISANKNLLPIVIFLFKLFACFVMLFGQFDYSLITYSVAISLSLYAMTELHSFTQIRPKIE